MPDLGRRRRFWERVLGDLWVSSEDPPPLDALLCGVVAGEGSPLGVQGGDTDGGDDSEKDGSDGAVHGKGSFPEFQSRWRGLRTGIGKTTGRGIAIDFRTSKFTCVENVVNC